MAEAGNGRLAWIIIAVLVSVGIGAGVERLTAAAKADQKDLVKLQGKHTEDIKDLNETDKRFWQITQENSRNQAVTQKQFEQIQKQLDRLEDRLQ